MRWTRRIAGSLAVAVLLIAAGCTGMFGPSPAGEDGPSGPDAGIATRGLTGGGFYLTDLAVDPASFDYVVMGAAFGGEGTTGLQVIARTTGEILRSWSVPVVSLSLGMMGPGHAFISDGGWNHYDVDLVTGVFTRVRGMEAVTERTLAFVDGAYYDGGYDTVATIECEPSRGSPIIHWSGESGALTLHASVRLAFDGLDHVDGVAYVPDRNLFFVLNVGEGIFAISTVTGELERTITDVDLFLGLAYDPLTDQLVQMDVGATNGSGVAIVAHDI